MINLLPPSRAEAIRYGRQNTILRGWLIGAVAAIGGLIIILLSGWIYMDQQSRSLQKDIAVTNQQLQAQNLAGIQKDAKEITGDITVINKILSQEVKFSELIQTLGNIMPPDTVLGNLSLSNKISGALDLTASVKTDTAIAQVVANLTDPQHQLFTKVDIVSVNCAAQPNDPYPCTVSLRALFSKTAQTQFLSVPAGDKS